MSQVAHFEFVACYFQKENSWLSHPPVLFITEPVCLVWAAQLVRLMFLSSWNISKNICIRMNKTVSSTLFFIFVDKVLLKPRLTCQLQGTRTVLFFVGLSARQLLPQNHMIDFHCPLDVHVRMTGLSVKMTCEGCSRSYGSVPKSEYRLLTIQVCFFDSLQNTAKKSISNTLNMLFVPLTQMLLYK